jgi:hypothetical protein
MTDLLSVFASMPTLAFWTRRSGSYRYFYAQLGLMTMYITKFD